MRLFALIFSGMILVAGTLFYFIADMDIVPTECPKPLTSIAALEKFRWFHDLDSATVFCKEEISESGKEVLRE